MLLNFKVPPSKLITDMVSYWLADGSVTIKSPVSLQEVSDFEKKFGVALPVDFANLLFLSNGFEQNSACEDQNGFNFLPLEEINSVPNCNYGTFGFAGAHDYYIFCSYLGYCWAYALCLAPGDEYGAVVIVGTQDGRPVPIAKNFAEFVALYLRDDERLYG